MGQTDTHAKRMKGKLREVYEIAVGGDKVTHRAYYYATKDLDGPIAVLDVFIKKSTSGISTPLAITNRIVDQLQRMKAIEKQKWNKKYLQLLDEGWEQGSSTPKLPCERRSLHALLS